MRSRFVALVLLFLATFAAAAEVPLTPPTPFLPQLGETLDAIASDGRNFFILYSTFTSVVGLRSFNGTIIGPDGALIASVAMNIEGTLGRVASSGNGYLVVVEQLDGDVALRIGGAGEILDSKPFPLGAGGHPRIAPAPPLNATWDGSRYAVVAGNLFENVLRAKFVSEAGQVSGGMLVIPELTGAGIAGRDGISIIAWESLNAVWVRTIAGNDAGPAMLVATLPPGTPRSAPSIAAGDDGFMLLWTAGGITTGQHLDRDGQLDGPQFSFTASLLPPHVAWDGATYVALWSDNATVRAARLTALGILGAPFDVTSAGATVNATAVASNRSRTLAVFSANAIFMKFLDASTATALHPRLPGQFEVRATFNGAEDVVFWRQETASLSELHFAPLEGYDTLLLTGNVSIDDVASVSGITLLVWTDFSSTSVRAERISANGSVLDAAPMQLATSLPPGIPNARIVADGTSFVVFWRTATAILAQRITPDGTRVGSPSSVFAIPLPFEVAPGDSGFLLITGATAILIANDLTPVARATFADAAPVAEAVASDGKDFLVVWATSKNEIAARRILANGALPAPRIVLTADATRKGTPRLRWEGAWFNVTWPELIDATTFAFASARVSRDGSAATPKVYVARGPMQPSWFPAMLSDWRELATPRPTLVYSRFDQPPGLNPSARIFVQSEGAARRRAAGH